LERRRGSQTAVLIVGAMIIVERVAVVWYGAMELVARKQPDENFF
jgi:hypothetical protein